MKAVMVAVALSMVASSALAAAPAGVSQDVKEVIIPSSALQIAVKVKPSDWTIPHTTGNKGKLVVKPNDWTIPH